MSQLQEKGSNNSIELPEKIGVGNFKAFGDLQRVGIKPITLVYGKNSSGKSSFIQSLLYLKSVKSNGKFDLKNTKFGNFGGFDRFIHGRTDGKTLVFQFDIQEEAVGGVFTIRLEITRNMEQPTRPVQLKQILFLSAEEDEPFVKLVCSSKGRYSVHFEKSSQIFINLVDQEAESLEVIDDFFECVQTDNFLMPDRVITKREKEQTDISREVRERLENFFNRSSIGISEFLDNISYLSGNRTVADRGILDGSGLSSDEEDSGGLYYWERIRKESDLRKKVNEYLGLLFPISKESSAARYEIVAEDLYTLEDASEVAEDVRELFEGAHSLVGDEMSEYSIENEEEPSPEDSGEFTNQFKKSLLGKGARTEIRIRDVTNGLRLLPHELGFGVGQVIPIVAAACLPGRTVIIEQPETHLHPKQQADLGEILASSLALQEGGGERSSFIIETHSIHILERLGKIIRETSKEKDFKGLKLKPGEVGVYYISQENSSVGVRTMELNAQGKLSRDWPDGFFNEDVGDLF